MKLRDLKAGDKVVADAGFTCLKPGVHEVHNDPDLAAKNDWPGSGLFIYCTGADDAPDPDGRQKHFLDGQEGAHGELIGLSRPE